MFRATDQQLQSLLITAQKLSHYHHIKFPDIDYDEFYSISQVAIAEALKTYKPTKGKLNLWVRAYLYARFNKYLIRQYKKQKDILNKLRVLGISIQRPEQ
jgi:hypothetical protein